MFKFIFVIFFLFCTFPSKSTIITETWKTIVTGGQLYNLDQSYISIGQEIYWSVTYEDSKHYFNKWNDGLDGTADFGKNDDTLLGTSSWQNMASDATFDLSNFENITDKFINDNNINTRDLFSYNWSWTTKNGYGTRSFNLFKDDTFFAAKSIGLSIYSKGVSIEGESVFVTFGAIPVPEPSTLFLFIFGLIGIKYIKFE